MPTSIFNNFNLVVVSKILNFDNPTFFKNAYNAILNETGNSRYQ